MCLWDPTKSEFLVIYLKIGTSTPGAKIYHVGVKEQAGQKNKNGLFSSNLIKISGYPDPNTNTYRL
jgi:hypothetical protein